MHHITFQIRFFRPKFVIKFLNPAFLTPIVLLFPKIYRRRIHGTIHSSTSQLSLENLTNNLTEKLFKKWSELTPSRKQNTCFRKPFIFFKIPTWLVISKTQFSKDNNKIMQSKDHNTNTKT